MSAIQAPHGVTYSGKEAMEYIWLPAITVGGLEDFFKVITSVNTKTQVLFAKQLDKITFKDSGCDPVYNDQQIQRSEKFWNPNPVEATLKQCYTDVYGSFFEQKLRAGTDRPKLEGTEIEKFILEAMVPAADRDLQRMVWLSRKNILAANLTGGAADVKNYNQVDGIWSQITAGAVSGRTPRYTIAKNTATTTAGQQLAAGESKTILRAVYNNQKLVMKQMKDSMKRFLVTRDVYDNYAEYLEDNDQLESARMQLTNGTSTLKFRGIPLEIIDVVDAYLESDFVFGAGANTTVTDPHRVTLTVKDNLQVALDTPTAMPVAFETWDEKKEKRWYARAMFELDTMVAIEELVSVAY